MATYKKERKEIDQAIRHLMDYMAKQSPWDDSFEELTIQFIEPVAEELNRDLKEVTEELLLTPEYGDAAWGYLFEEMAGTHWGNDKFTMTDVYLKERGWREKPHGKAYLRALSASEIKLWVVKDAEPGEWIDLQLYGTDKKLKRIQERSASQHVRVGDCIAARVIRVGKNNNITGAPLPITPDQAKYIEEKVDGVPEETHEIYQQLVKEKKITAADVPDDLSDEIASIQDELTVQMAFTVWAVEALRASTSPIGHPSISNSDNEEIVLTKQRYKIKKNRETVIERLDENFTALEGDSIWHWHNDDDLIMATITMKKDALHVETNSLNRADATEERLRPMLEGLLGEPIAIHESLDYAALDRTPQASPIALDDAAIHENFELQQTLANHLKKHYEGLLDDPIPMLGNLTPRECAAQPENRDKVIDWLKDLDLHNKKTGQPFDSTPLWEELNLTSYRTSRS